MPENNDLLGFAINVERTQSIAHLTHQCECDFCVETRIEMKRFAPPSQAARLQSLGLDPNRPTLSGSEARRRCDPKTHHRVISCWYVYGQPMESFGHKVYLDRQNWMWASKDRNEVSAFSSELDEFDFSDPTLHFIYVSNLSPTLIRQVTEFRIEQLLPCQECGGQSWRTGYLKHRSLIPEWYEVPEIALVLARRQNRVMAKFCSQCGRLQFDIVGRTPPFRTVDNVERLRMRRLLAWHRRLESDITEP